MIIDGAIVRLKAAGVICVEAPPSFTSRTKIAIVKAIIDRISNDSRYKTMPALTMTVEPL